MTMEAIILAGGLGTRLRSAVPDLPKPMAPVNGRPFLAILLDALVEAGFSRVILAVGYRYEAIVNQFGDSYRSLALRYSIEAQPLGTGGGIRLALQKSSTEDVFVLNGDTYLELNYSAMLAAHRQAGTRLTVAVREMRDASRYGSLYLSENRIVGFREKGRSGPGKINGGTYLIRRNLLTRYQLGTPFSFEVDLLMSHARELNALAFETRGEFIDIGIPQDYARAQRILSRGRKLGARDNQDVDTGFSSSERQL